MLSAADLQALVAALGVGLECVCGACLCVVSFALEDGDEDELRRVLRRMTPDLWADGLAEHALVAVRRACVDGVAGAREALAELERLGGRAPTARALVLHLARLQVEDLRRRSAALWN